MSRTNREFRYTNSDGQDGCVEVSFGPWSTERLGEAPIMVTFDDAMWMGITEAEKFQRWLTNALIEAKWNHLQGNA